jgi:hypothetical protein
MAAAAALPAEHAARWLAETVGAVAVDANLRSVGR